ncbi:hypothetical protein CPLU01_13012 [Colletotrichum plurivorum]|uniref:Uncharacterized protein n=1 Tax=Colletotrichum plurivorum TaxID=2175906 RepID=A0A8H6JVH3_9PEZI|nr:hypothetical protein CPLU01_13012 [Colletotrichum plurivorum]
MQFSTLAAFLVTVLAGQALAAPQRNGKNNNNGNSRDANAGKEGQACVGQVGNLDRDGTCNANGKCIIFIPPNENNIVASEDCE